MVEERVSRAPGQNLEATVEKLGQQVRWLSRHVLALEHDLAIYRIQERIPLGRRLQTAWQSLVRALRAFAEEWVDRSESDRL